MDPNHPHRLSHRDLSFPIIERSITKLSMSMPLLCASLCAMFVCKRSTSVPFDSQSCSDMEQPKSQTLSKPYPNPTHTIPPNLPNAYTNPTQTRFKLYTNLTQTIPKPYPNPTQTRFKLYTNLTLTIPKPYPKPAQTLPKLYPNLTQTLPKPNSNPTQTIPKPYTNLTQTLPIY